MTNRMTMTRRSFLRAGAVTLATSSLFSRGLATEQEEQPLRFLMEWGKQGKEPGEFFSPIGIFITSADKVFVTDSRNKRVQQFSTEGKFIFQFPVPDGTRLGGPRR